MEAVPTMDDRPGEKNGHPVRSLETIYRINICSFYNRYTSVERNGGALIEPEFCLLTANFWWDLPLACNSPQIKCRVNDRKEDKKGSV